MRERSHPQVAIYREQARQARAAADGTSDLQCRKALHRIAEGYEDLASKLEDSPQMPDGAGQAIDGGSS